MQTEIAETIFEKVKVLPIESQKDFLKFVDKVEIAATKKLESDRESRRLTLWETID